MSRKSGTGWRWLAVTVVLAVLCGVVAGLIARGHARDALAQSTLTDATLRAALLDSEVARFRLLPLALRDDSDVVTAIAGRPGAPMALDRKLEALARDTGAAAIYVLGADGIALAASNWRTARSFVGSDYRFRRYVQDAMRLGAASQFARGTVSGRPGLYLSRRTAAGGVVVVKLEFDQVEADWARAGGETFVHDGEGLILVSSHPEWRFATVRRLSAERLAAVRREASLPPTLLRPLPNPTGYVARSVRTAYPGWTLTLRRPVGPVARPAGLAAGIGSGLAVAVLGALGWAMRQRRHYARRRTSELEEAVAARTAELTREIEDRAASEARAAELREGLRQANRLATLGQVTASVAHETAQPVAAIRNYAATSATLLEQGHVGGVFQNLDAIARLADRIGTITAELRGFSRRRTGAIRFVPLAEVIDGALLILREQLRAVTLACDPVAPDLLVRGGRVRLEQVLVNLLQNSLEALRDRPAPAIAITLRRDGDHAVLTVADNGPGIDPDLASRLFTPFVTSRPEGLGLGLVIAHDIMIEFGGTLRYIAGEGGARFEIVMAVAVA